MKAFVINLASAVERRRRMEEQFALVGLEATFYPAFDKRELTPEHYDRVDRETRRQLGLWPQADGSIANWISQRQVMAEIVENGPETVAIFEDDAGLSADLPKVLDALERRPFAFDIVKLNRRSSKTFIPCERLETGHRVGRVRYHDYGNEGYVITREAARHFLKNTPMMMREIDQAIPRFWGKRAERILRRPARRLARRAGRLPDRARPQDRTQGAQACRRRSLRDLETHREHSLAGNQAACSLPASAARRNRRHSTCKAGIASPETSSP